MHTHTSLSWFCWDTRGTGVTWRSLITFPTCQVKKYIYKIHIHKKREGRTTQDRNRNVPCLETLSYLCCHSVHWCLVDLLVLEVLWALGLPSHQEILPKRKMVRREKSDIKKVIMQDMTTFFYLEALSLLLALVAPSLPWALLGLSLVGNTRRN